MVCSILTAFLFFSDEILLVPIGKTLSKAKDVDVTSAISCFRYYAGWVDKVHGKTIEVGAGAWSLEVTFSTSRDRPMRINSLTQGMNRMVLWYGLLLYFFYISPSLARDKLFRGTSPWFVFFIINRFATQYMNSILGIGCG